MDTPQISSQFAETSDISASGLCLVADLSLPIGTSVEMILTMPAEVMREPARDWCCHGRVVRVGDGDTGRNTRTIAVKFLYYEVLRKPTDYAADLLAAAATRGRWR